MVLPATAIVYCLLYVRLIKEHSQLVSVVSLMIVSLPFSWNPIWGGSVGSSIITWYYLWTGIAIILVFVKKTYKAGQYQSIISLLCLFLIIYSFIPLFNSESLLEGFKDFIMIVFFLLIMLGTNSKKAQCNETDKELLMNLYIFTVFLISAGMLIQFVGYRFFDMVLFGFKKMYSWGGEIQTGCHLLMEDASSGTIMLGAGAMLALINRKKNKAYVLELLIIVIGIACSGRRTGALTLVLMMGVYFVLGVKSFKGRIASVFGFAVLARLLLYFMSASRSAFTIDQMLNDNGRFQLGYEGLQLFFKSPLLGYGFDNYYLGNVLMPSRMIVHNTVIRWLDMGGIFLGLAMILIFSLWILLLKQKKQTDFMWCLLYCCAAAMLIPDILNARFIYSIALISIMSVNGLTGNNSRIKEEKI